MNKVSANELYIRLTSMQRINAGPAREKIKDWVEAHRKAVCVALEELATNGPRLEFVKSIFFGKLAVAGSDGTYDAYSPTEISVPTENGTLEYMWLTEESLYVRVAVSDFYKRLVETIVPEDHGFDGEGVGPFWEAVVEEFVSKNIEEFGGELQVLKDSTCLLFQFRKEIPDFITPSSKGRQ